MRQVNQSDPLQEAITSLCRWQRSPDRGLNPFQFFDTPDGQNRTILKRYCALYAGLLARLSLYPTLALCCHDKLLTTPNAGM